MAVTENIVSREFPTSIGITVASQTAALVTTHHDGLCEVNGGIVGFASGNRSKGELAVIAVLSDLEGKNSNLA